jgi:hypothetical protein
VFAVLIISAAGAATCLALGLVLCLSGRLGIVDPHENSRLATALALLMPLLVLATLGLLQRDLASSSRIIDVTILALSIWGLGTLFSALRAMPRIH